MNKNDRAEIGAILLVLNDRNKGINDALDSIRTRLSDSDGEVKRFQWVSALAQALAELETTAELIEKIINVNKTRADFDPHIW